MRRSCSDSLLTASQVDGVFGSDSRIISVLEGGYHLEGLARSVAAHVAALMGAGKRI